MERCDIRTMCWSGPGFHNINRQSSERKWDNVGDIVTENANEGTGSVSSSISYILGANLEKLALSGSADPEDTGNDLGNVLSGNSGANDLYGLAGEDSLPGDLGDDWLAGELGGDTLTGGAGKDMFIFDVLETSAHRDTIKDFEQGIAEILISRSAFSAFTGSVADALSANAFVVGVAATTAAHHIVYNNATGALYYDPDGVGGQSHIQIALLSTKPFLDAAGIKPVHYQRTFGENVAVFLVHWVIPGTRKSGA